MSNNLKQDVEEQLRFIDGALSQAEELVTSLSALNYNEITNELNTVEKAKYDVTILYAINSLYWAYVRSQGENPQQHPIKGEIDRIKELNSRLKGINDDSKIKMPKLDKGVANRMIRHELGCPETRSNDQYQTESWS